MEFTCKPPPKDIDKWQKWQACFCWLPQLVGTPKDAKWVWLCKAERRFMWCGSYGSYWKLWDYRETTEQKDGEP